MDDRMRMFMADIKALYELNYNQEFVVDIVIIFMPRDGRIGEEIESPVAKGRFGRFVKTS